MKLDEKDIKAVAASRYWHEGHRAWKIAGMLFGTLFLFIALEELTGSIFSILPMVLGFTFLIWIAVKADKYIANLVTEWKASTEKETDEG